MDIEKTHAPNHLANLFAHNRQWAAQMERDRPGFFSALLRQQTPQYMWIGCSDSRVPANQIAGLNPGEVFVHRNIANVVVHSDLNALSTIQYAVDMLKVEHIMVVGHYGCGGVLGALNNVRVGLADNWLRHIQDVRDMHQDILDAIAPVHHHDALCELNVIEQVMNTVRTTVLQDAWQSGQDITVHGWVYGLRDGLLQDLCMSINRDSDSKSLYRSALDAVARRARD